MEQCDRDSLLVREQFHIDSIPKAQRYNICLIAGNRLGLLHTDVSKRKMSESHTGVKLTGERLEAHAARLRAVAATPEHSARMCKLKTGVKLSDEVKQKISAAHKGKILSESHRAAISAAQKGIAKPRTAEHSARIGLAHRGKVLSAETRAKISEALKGRKMTATTRAAIAAANAARNTSGYTGVSFDKRSQRYYAYARVGEKMKNLGLHDTAEAARDARDAYLREVNCGGQ